MKTIVFLLIALLVCGCRPVNIIEETNPKESPMIQETEILETEEEGIRKESNTAEVLEGTEEPGTTGVTEDSAQVVYKTPAEIQAYNQRLKSQPAAHLTDMGTFPHFLSGAEVRGRIEAYGIPDYPLVNGAAVTDAYKASLLAQRNLTQIPEQVAVQYAVTTAEAAVRSFPTRDCIGDGEFDYFQESMFLVGECVAILHSTADGAWCFVQGENYNGWVSRDTLALTDRGTWDSWWNQTLSGESCAVAVIQTAVSGTSCRMGTVLPMAGESGDGYRVVWPDKDNSGNLVKTQTVVPKSAFSKGYLPFTEAQVMTQVQRMVGTPYGWGDEGGNPDCSSTIQAIYRCFGFRLARNTSDQMVMSGAERILEGKYREEILGILQTKAPGTLLYTDGHVVMYVGMENGAPMIFHNVTVYSPDGVTQVPTYKAVITPFDICRRDGTSYYNVMHTLLDLTTQ